MTGQSKLLQLGVPRKRTRHRCLQKVERDGLKIHPVAVFRGTRIALSGESEAVPEASKPEAKTDSFACTYTRAGVGSNKTLSRPSAFSSASYTLRVS